MDVQLPEPGSETLQSFKVSSVEPRDAVGHDREQLGDVLCLGGLGDITEKSPSDPMVSGTWGSPAP